MFTREHAQVKIFTLYATISHSGSRSGDRLLGFKGNQQQQRATTKKKLPLTAKSKSASATLNYSGEVLWFIFQRSILKSCKGSAQPSALRSEERRVGKECRCR